MKRNTLIICVIVAAMVFISSCGQNNEKVELQTRMDSFAYVIGANIAINLKDNMARDSMDFNVSMLIAGFRDALQGNDSIIFTSAQKQEVMMLFQQDMQKKQMEKMAEMAKPNKEAGALWLAENKKKEGVIELPDGLQYKVIKEGSGKKPTIADTVMVHYEGTLIDGNKFDSSFDRKEPAKFPLSGVIKGWTEGLQYMKEGGKYELYLPSDLAYGDQGNQMIPGGSTLIFKVELLKVIPTVVKDNAPTQNITIQ